jgi:hypothetical protein
VAAGRKAAAGSKSRQIAVRLRRTSGMDRLPSPEAQHPEGTSWIERNSGMNCHELAQRIENLQPRAETRDVARLCLLLANTTDDVTKLGDEQLLTDAWREAGLKLQLATDQHAAMTEELESLARSDPKKFTPDQIWVLIRAIKVQSQILQLYVGDPLVEAT